MKETASVPTHPAEERSHRARCDGWVQLRCHGILLSHLAASSAHALPFSESSFAVPACVSLPFRGHNLPASSCLASHDWKAAAIWAHRWNWEMHAAAPRVRCCHAGVCTAMRGSHQMPPPALSAQSQPLKQEPEL